MDFANEYLTDSPDYRVVTQNIFTELFKQGSIVEDLRPNIYDPVEGTTIADAEVERLTRMTKLVDVKWQTENGEEMIIAKGGKPIVKMLPFVEQEQSRKGGQFKGLIEIADNFDAPLPEEVAKSFKGEDE